MSTSKNFTKTIFAVLLLLQALGALHATTITVTNGNDTGSGSLRNAISSSVAGDNIVFSGVTTVTLTSAELAISHNLTIDGGSGGVTVKRSGSTAFRIFEITGGSVTLTKLTISNGDGDASGGGGVYVIGGSTCTMNNCQVKSNIADQGAGIQNDGALVMTDCTVSGNGTQGGGLGGGILNYGSSITLTNCTISGNLNGQGFGAIEFRGGSAVSLMMQNCTVSGNNRTGMLLVNGALTATLLNCTITNNEGGIETSSGPSVSLKNVIVADNTTSDIVGSVNSSSSYNLIGTGGSGGLVNGVNNNQVNVANPGLLALASNGGPTETHALSTCSPAVNTGTNTGAPSTDQRGNTRPYNSGISDIGSYELQSVGGTISVSSTVTNVLCNGGSTGQIDLSITNGTSPYSYAWTGAGSGNDPRINLAAGTFTVTVTDAQGCTGTKSSTVSQPSALAISRTSSNVSCNGGNNGSITLTVTGGTGSYTYAWSGVGAGSNPRTNLAAGTYTVTVTDGNNCTKTNSTTISQPAAISITPTVTNATCPNANGSISLAVTGGTGGYTYAWTGTGSGNNPRTGLGAGTYTATVTDGNSCTATTVNAVASVDLTPPTITCPSNASVTADQNGNYTLTSYVGSTTANDNCTANPVITQSPASGTVLTIGTHTITMTATDAANLSANCTFSLTVQSACGAPVVTCPANASVSANSSCSAVLADYVPSSSYSGGCGSTNLSQSPMAGANLGLGSTTVTITATDANNNTGTCSFTVAVQDQTPPSISCPANANVNANAGCSGQIGAYAAASVSDNCAVNPSVTQSPASTTTLSGHNATQVVTLTANDGNGNSSTCTLTVTLKDVTKPSITCPTNATVNANAGCSGQIGSYAAASVSDNCAASPSVTQSPVSTTTLSGQNATQTVTLTANDGNGNTSTCTLTVTLKDVTPPSITCPANATVNANAGCSGQIGAYAATSVSDNCAASPSVTQSPVSTTTLSGQNATQTVTLTANDGNGNTSTCTLTVTLKDFTPPSITCPINATVNANAGCSGQIGAYAATSVSDNCAAIPSVTQSPVSTTTLSGHNATQTVTLTANDGNGNTSTCTLTVTLKDATSPSITCPANATVNANAGCSGQIGAYAATSVSDNCNPSPTVTQSPVSTTTLSGHNATQTVTLTANDGNGNTSTCTLTVTLKDFTPPSITCPTNVTVNANSGCSGQVGSYSATSLSDNCNASPTVTQSPAASTTLTTTQVVTLTANDGNGNTSTCTLTVTLRDATPPSITCPANATVNANASCSGQIGAYAATSVSDNCNPSPTVTQSPVSTTTLSGHNATQVVTLTANDGNGNTSTCTLTVTLKDVTPPSITCPTNVTVNANSGCSGQVGSYSATSLSDNCNASPTVTQSPAASTTLTTTQVVTLTANDGNGNTSTCTLTVTLRDATPPSITCPANATVNANAGCSGQIGAYAATTVSDNCNPSPTVTQSPVSTTTLSGNNATQVVTLTANDGNGNTSTCTLTVTLKDFTPPSITCPTNVTVNANSGCSGQVGAYSATSLSDNCNASPTVTQSPAASTTLTTTQVVTLTANDGNGNTSTCTLTVTLRDATPPSITCPANATVNANAGCSGQIGAYAAATVSDNCNPSPSVTQSPVSTTTLSGHNATQTVTLTANDGNGNTSTCTLTVTLKDFTPPSITCPTNATVNANASCSGQIGTYAATSVSDNCAASPSVTQSPASTTTLSGHNATQTVTLTANDGNGNTSTCTLTVTLKDATPPSITCPTNATVNANASCSGLVGSYAAATLSDNCNPSPTVTQSPAASSTLTGTQVVTLTANDGNGNTSTCTLTVTLKDATPPSITCPANATVNANASCSGQIGTYAATSVSDNCAASPSVTQSPVSTTTLSGHNATQTVTLTANDGNGNTSTCTLTVTLKDATPPSITCPTNATVNANASCSGQIGTYTAASLSDNCAASPSVTQSPSSTTTLSGHNATQVVTLTANDGNGNTSTCTLTVTLKDATPPSITCPANATVNANAGCSGQIGTYTAASLSDNCAASPSVTQSPVSTTTLSGHNATQVVTLTANDGNGNTSTCTLTVTLKDATAPSITCPANTTVNVGANCSITMATYSASSVSDNCTASPSVTQSPASGTSLFGNNTVQTVTLTASDAAGNTQTCTFTVTLRDVTAPVIQCKNITVNLSSAGAASITPNDVYQSGSDNCGTVNLLAVSPNSFNCLNAGNNPVLLSANDGNGNTASCTAVVTVKDVTLPVAKCKNASISLTTSGTVTLLPSAIDNGTSDNCSYSLVLIPNTFGCANLGINNVVLRATDASGNTATCSAKVTVIDNTGPTAKCKNATIFLNNSGAATLSPSQVDNGSFDACGIASMTVSQTSFNCSELEGSSWPVTLSLKDVNGNTSSCLAYVTVKDAIAPTAICQDKTVAIANGYAVVYGSDLGAPSTDNCSVWSYSPVAKVYTSLGVYNLTVTVRDWSGNTATCVSQVTVVNPFGGGNEDRSDKPVAIPVVDLFPNPTSGNAMLAFELPAEQEFELKVFDISGRLVFNWTGLAAEGENNIELDLNNLDSGVYVVDFRTEAIKVRKKLVIQRN